MRHPYALTAAAVLTATIVAGTAASGGHTAPDPGRAPRTTAPTPAHPSAEWAAGYATTTGTPPPADLPYWSRDRRDQYDTGRAAGLNRAMTRQETTP